MKRISYVFLFILTASAIYSSSYAGFFWTPAWIRHMKKEVRKIEKSFDGEFGVYIYDLKSGEAFDHKAKEFWYLSSTVKVPVAVALLQLVDQKRLNLSEKVSVYKDDYRDGAGTVNWIEPGQKVSYKYLLQQMLIYSDNAATDLIIKKVGLENVNKLVAQYAIQSEFGPITTLLDVRVKAYGEMHPRAKDLSNMAFMRIKKKKGSKNRTQQLAKELKIEVKDLPDSNLNRAFERYYSQKWNSATLVSYSEFLKNILSKKILSSDSTQYLLKVMAGIQTGKKRVRKGLSADYYFAHKTGTQHRRACDVGVVGDRKTKRSKLLFLVCTSNWKSLSKAEQLMAQIAKALSATDRL